MKRSAQPPELAFFRRPVRQSTRTPWWHSVLRWSRDGLIRIKPLSKDEAELSLTAKGRDQAGLPPIKENRQ